MFCSQWTTLLDVRLTSFL